MAGRLATYIAAAFAGVAAAFFLSGIFCIASVSGDGMEPVLESGDTVIITGSLTARVLLRQEI